VKPNIIAEEAAEYLEEISSSNSFPFSDGRLSMKEIGKGFDFTFNHQNGDPGAIIYGEVLEDTMKLRYGFNQTYNQINVEKVDSVITTINLALDHILTEMDYSGREQYLNSKNLPTTVE
jgi:hypothetical protein